MKVNKGEEGGEVRIKAEQTCVYVCVCLYINYLIDDVWDGVIFGEEAGTSALQFLFCLGGVGI